MGGLTPSQIARPATFAGDHRAVREGEGSPDVERPDGRPVRVQPNRRLAAATHVPSVQSYLHVERC